MFKPQPCFALQDAARSFKHYYIGDIGEAPIDAALLAKESEFGDPPVGPPTIDSPVVDEVDDEVPEEASILDDVVDALAAQYAGIET